MQSLRPVRRVAELGSLGRFTRMKTLTLTLAVLAMFCGCATQQTADAGVEDWRGKQTGGICPVHHVAMRTEIVYATEPGYCAIWPDDYVEARRTRFPYAGIEYGPELYGTRRGKIYVCRSCELAR